MAVLTALAVVFSILAVRERNNAIRERNQAVSAEVATVANQLYGSNPALAGQLSLAAFKLAPSPEAYGSLLNGTAKPLADQLAPIPDSDAEAFNADGSMLATSSTDGVQLWQVNAADPTNPTLVTTIRSTHAINSSPQLWFDPGNSTILAILYGRYISLEDIDHPYPFSAGNRTAGVRAISSSPPWGARVLHDRGYAFALAVNWVAPRTPEETLAVLKRVRSEHPRKQAATLVPVRFFAAAVGAARCGGGTGAVGAWNHGLHMRGPAGAGRAACPRRQRTKDSTLPAFFSYAKANAARTAAVTVFLIPDP